MSAPFDPLKITIHTDGTGIYYDPFEPLHLDGVLAAMLCRWHAHGEPPARDEEPIEIPLPLARWEMEGVWGFRASAIFPEGATAEGLTHWRKRFREHRAHLVESASPNLTNGTYRAWDMPLPLTLCRTWVAYAVGNRRKVREALKDLKYLGKKRAHGHGRIVSIDVDRVDEDWSIEREGLAQRWLPNAEGSRLVRPRAPYWSTVGRVLCGEVGDRIARRRAS